MIKAALFDVDGTLVDARVWQGILDHPDVSRWRVRKLYAGMMPRLWWRKLNPAFDVHFRAHWIQGLAVLLKGWSVEAVDALAQQVAEAVLTDASRVDVIAFLKAHKEQGQPVILVSTMFPAILEHIAGHVGADAVLGTPFTVRNGVITGQLAAPPCVGPGKIKAAQTYFAEHAPDIDLSMCAAYADSFSDVPLLAAAGQPCAVYPDEKLRAVAIARGWRIHPSAAGISFLEYGGPAGPP
ncbi:HAD family hydrolase [Chloroflexota bacterium]